MSAQWSPYEVYTEGHGVMYTANVWFVAAGLTSHLGVPPPDGSVWIQSGVPGVTSIVAGNNIAITPSNGLGNVTVALTASLTGLGALGVDTLTAVGVAPGTASITATSGDIVASNGGLSASVGLIVSGTGITIGNPTITATSGDIVANSGNLTANNGALNADSGVIAGSTVSIGTPSFTVTSGDIKTLAGNIESYGALLVDGTGITLGNNSVLVSSGDITTVAGNITASGNVSANGHFVVQSLLDKDNSTTLYETGTQIGLIGNSAGTAGTGVGIQILTDATNNAFQFVNTGVVGITAGTNITTSTATSALGENTITVNATITAYVNDIWVSSAGSDSTGTGSITTPYATIGKATTIANAITASATIVNIHILSGTYSASITTLTRPNVFFIGYGSPVISASLTITPSTVSYYGGGCSNLSFASSYQITLTGNCAGYSFINCICPYWSIISVMSSGSIITFRGCSTIASSSTQTVNFAPSSGSSASVLNIINCSFITSVVSNILYFSTSFGLTLLIDDCQITSTTTGSTYSNIIAITNTSSSNAINTTLTNNTIQYTNTATASSGKLCIFYTNSQTAGTDSLVIDDCVMVCEGSNTYQYGASGGFLFMNTSLSGSSTRLTLSLNNVVCGSGLLDTASKTPLQSNKLSKFPLAPAVSPRVAQLYYTSSQALITGNTSFTTGQATTLLIKVIPDIPGDIIVSYMLNITESITPAAVINSQMGWFLGTNSTSGSWNTLGSAFGQSYPAGATSLTGNTYGSFVYSLTPTLFQNLGTSSGFDGSITFFVSVWDTAGTSSASIIAGSQITAQYNIPQATYS